MLSQAHEVLTGLAMDPHLANCETEMARSAMLRGDFDEAVALAGRPSQRCTKRGLPEIAHARVVRGLALAMSGQPDEGIAASRMRRSS